MSLAVTNLTANRSAGASVSGFTTASVSPTANGLLILSAGGFDGTGSQDFTVSSVSGFGATWTRQHLGVAGSTPKGDVEAWTAKMGGSPGSGAITVTLSATFSGGVAWAVDQATGQDATTPVVTGNTVAANNSSAASAVTYGTAGSASNLFWFMSVVLLGAAGVITQAPSESPAWTSLSQGQSDTTTFNGASLHTQVSPDVTHLTGSAAWSGSHSWGTIGLEIAAASGGTPHTATASLTITPSLSASRTRGKFRTGSLTVTPSFTASRAAARFRTASRPVTPSFSVSRVRGRFRTGSLTASPSFTASRARAAFRTGSLAVVPSLAAGRAQGHFRSALLAAAPAFTATASRGHNRTASLSAVPSFRAVPSGGTSRVILAYLGAARWTWRLGNARNS